MTGKRPQCFIRGDIPAFHGFIKAPGKDDFAVGRKSHGVDRICVSPVRADFFARGNVPEIEGVFFVPSAGNEVFAVGGAADRVDCIAARGGENLGSDIGSRDGGGLRCDGFRGRCRFSRSRGMSHRSRQILRFLAPVRDQQDDFISGTYGGNGILKLAGRFDVLVVDGKDNIIEPDAHFFRRTFIDHFGDNNNRPPSIFHVHDPHIFSRNRLNGYAKPGFVCRGCRRC
ncbi:MAG: hypothetical protein BWX45_00335 [Deltaproteobacteria bacterium ADurb.Bin002]|nr:MAG: hypothetical protein BWX45_00335 [Deltaproteobacteria bacterium ADurb.Bin002]